MTLYNFISFFGIFVLIFIGWLFSSNRARMNWRVIGWGTGLQLLFGLFVFRVPAGTRIFLWVNDAVIGHSADEAAFFIDCAICPERDDVVVKFFSDACFKFFENFDIHN